MRCTRGKPDTCSEMTKFGSRTSDPHDHREKSSIIMFLDVSKKRVSELWRKKLSPCSSGSSSSTSATGEESPGGSAAAHHLSSVTTDG